MTQEEKQLLLKDLCARLPYGVKYVRDSWNYEWDQEMTVIEVLEDIDKDGYINYHKVYKVQDIMPYLRPMSSMTEEEAEQFESMSEELLSNGDREEIWDTVIDWLNEHYFDHRHLIEKGLALEAPEDMYV